MMRPRHKNRTIQIKSYVSKGIEQTTFGKQRHSKVEKQTFCRRYQKKIFQEELE